MQLTLTAAKTAAYNGIKEALRLRITRDIKMETKHSLSGMDPFNKAKKFK